MSMVRGRIGLSLLWVPIILVACYFEICATAILISDGTNISQGSIIPTIAWMLALFIIVVSIRFRGRIIGNVNMLSKYISWSGKLSYQIYLLHLPISYLALFVLLRFSLNRYLAWFLTVLTVFVVAGLVTSFVEPRLQNITRNAINSIRSRLVRSAVEPI
jgi:peptidoglycan/LPS O-acetylase OafA/YrhL